MTTGSRSARAPALALEPFLAFALLPAPARLLRFAGRALLEPLAGLLALLEHALAAARDRNRVRGWRRYGVPGPTSGRRLLVGHLPSAEVQRKKCCAVAGLPSVTTMIRENPQPAAMVALRQVLAWLRKGLARLRGNPHGVSQGRPRSAGSLPRACASGAPREPTPRARASAPVRARAPPRANRARVHCLGGFPFQQRARLLLLLPSPRSRLEALLERSAMQGVSW